MIIVELRLACLHPAYWNPNILTAPKRSKLKSSIETFDIVENMVVRPLDGETYEVLSGNQRLEIYREMGLEAAPCVVLESRGLPDIPSTNPCKNPTKEPIEGMAYDPELWVPIDCGRCASCRARRKLEAVCGLNLEADAQKL